MKKFIGTMVLAAFALFLMMNFLMWLVTDESLLVAQNIF